MRKVNLIIALAAIISIGANVVMIERNRMLSDQYTIVQGRFLAKSRVTVGDVIPAFPIKPLYGSSAGLSESGGVKVLQFVSMRCAASEEQMVQWWPMLSSDPRLEATQPTLVSIDDSTTTEQALPQGVRAGNIVATANLFLQRAFRITSVPILIVSTNGTVTWAHFGTLTDSAYNDLIAHIENQTQPTEGPS